jgi:drug/metabolite transporter (DMT)-like permease
MLLAGLVVAWGSSFAMTKVAVTHLDPAWVMALRLAIAGILLLGFAVTAGHALPRHARLWGWFSWLGIIGHAAPFFLISWGTQYVTSGLSGVLMGAIPLMVIVLAHFWLPDERLTLMKAIGFVVGFAGLMIVLGVGGLAGISQEWQALKGEIAIIAGCLCYAVHGIFARRIPYAEPVPQAAAVCLCGGAFGLVFAAAAAPAGLASDYAPAYLSVIGLGILPTGIATLMMYRIVRNCGVSFVAYSNYLVPVYALGFGAVTLGEPLALNVGIGLALILAGIAVSRLRAGAVAAQSP